MQAKEVGLGYRIEWEGTLYLVPTPLVKIDSRNRFHSLTNPSVEWKKGAKFYYIQGINFKEDLWKKISDKSITPKEVFAIENTEQRRIAYEQMDKLKMKELDNYKVVEESKDDYGNTQKIISFDIKGFDKPFIYFNCLCPSTKREYFLQTEELTCEKAKAKSFGLDILRFSKEY
jgi:hypothetical protein